MRLERAREKAREREINKVDRKREGRREEEGREKRERDKWGKERAIEGKRKR